MLLGTAVVAVIVTTLGWFAPRLAPQLKIPATTTVMGVAPSGESRPTPPSPEVTLLRSAAADLKIVGWDNGHAAELPLGSSSKPIFTWRGEILVASVRLDSLAAGPAATFRRGCQHRAGTVSAMEPGVYLVLRGVYRNSLDRIQAVTSWYVGDRGQEDILARPAFCRAFLPGNSDDLDAPEVDPVRRTEGRPWNGAARTRYLFTVPTGGLTPGTPVTAYPTTVAGLMLVPRQPGPPALAPVWTAARS